MKNSNITGFNSWYKKNKLNEQDNEENRSNHDRPVLVVQSLKGEIVWMSAMSYANAHHDQHGYEDALQSGACDMIYIVDIGENESPEIWSGGNRPSSTPANELYFQDANIIDQFDTEWAGVDDDDYGDDDDDYDDDDDDENLLDNHFKGSTPDDFPTF
jgi:hypothetical protein